MKEYDTPAKRMLYKLKNKYFTGNKAKKANERLSISINKLDKLENDSILNDQAKIDKINENYSKATELDKTTAPLRHTSLRTVNNLNHLNHFERNDRRQKTVGILKNFLSKRKKSSIRIDPEIAPNIAYEKSRWTKLSEKMEKFIHSGLFAFISTAIIVLELFIEDFKVLFLLKEADIYVDFYMLVAAGFFFCEMILSCIFVRNYMFSFFFFVDILSTVSLSPYLSILYEDHEHPQEFTYESTGSILTTFYRNTHITKASKASLAGTKLSRIYSIFKVLRVFSLGRIYKHNLDTLMKKNEEIIITHKKNKKQIVTQRRKSVQIKSLEDKIKFFKQVHQVLNIPNASPDKVNNQLSQEVPSNINPLIIKNFYEYALKNEIKRDPQLAEGSGYRGTLIENVSHFDIDVPVKKPSNRPSGIPDPLLFNEEEMGNNTIVRSIFKDPNDDGFINSPTSHNLTRQTNFCKCEIEMKSKLNEGDGENDISININLVNNSNVNINKESSEKCKQCGKLKLGKENLMESINTYLQIDGSGEEMDEQNKHNIGEDKTSENNIDLIKLEKEEEEIEEVDELSNCEVAVNNSTLNAKAKRDSAFSFLNKFNISPVRSKKKLSKFKTTCIRPNRAYTIKDDDITTNINEMKPSNSLTEITKSIVNGSRGSKQTQDDHYTMKFFEDFHSEVNNNTKLAISTSKVITMRVVLIVLIIMFLDPFINIDNYTNTEDSYSFQADLMANYLATNKIDRLLFNLDKIINNDSFKADNDFELIEVGFSDSLAREAYNITEIFQSDLIFKNETLYNNTRTADRVYVDNPYFYIVYSIQYTNELTSILSIIRIFFIAACLWLFSFFFVFDVNNLVIIPLEELFNVMKTKKIENESLYYDVDKAIEADFKQYTNVYEDILCIEKFFRIMSCLVVKVIGIRYYDFFRPRIVADIDLNLNKETNLNLKGYILVCRIANFNHLINKLGEEICPLLSKIIGIIDLTVFENYGEIMKINCDTIIVFFDRTYLENLKDEKVTGTGSKINFKVKVERVKKLLANLCLLSAIHIISRVKFLIKTPEMIDLNISLHKGKLHSFLINTNNKVDICIYSKNLRKVLNNLVYMI
jgi:ribosomal protein L31E